MSTSTSETTPESFFSNKALVTGVFTATAIFMLIIGGWMIWFLCKAGLVCTPKHNNIESPTEPAERRRGRKTREKKTTPALRAPNLQSKLSPHPTMGGVFPLSTLLSAEEAHRRKGEPRDVHEEAPKPSRQPNLQPVIEAPTPTNVVLPIMTRTFTPPPGPRTPIQIERHPYAQARGYSGS